MCKCADFKCADETDMQMGAFKKAHERHLHICKLAHMHIRKAHLHITA
jgi:hypothetical protein